GRTCRNSPTNARIPHRILALERFSREPPKAYPIATATTIAPRMIFIRCRTALSLGGAERVSSKLAGSGVGDLVGPPLRADRHQHDGERCHGEGDSTDPLQYGHRHLLPSGAEYPVGGGAVGTIERPYRIAERLDPDARGMTPQHARWPPMPDQRPRKSIVRERGLSLPSTEAWRRDDARVPALHRRRVRGRRV